MKNLFLFFAVSIISLSAFAGSDGEFIGYVKYSIKMEGEMSAQEKAQQPTEMTVSYSGPKSRLEIVTPMQTQVILGDASTKEQFILLDMMGKKIALKTTAEDLEKGMKEAPEIKVNVTEETKEIAGYKCKKAEVVIGEETNIFWVTDDIAVKDPNWSTPYKELTGVLMEYSMVQNEITITYTATEVKKKKLKSLIFTVPAGYEEMTVEQFQEIMGG